MRFLHTADWHLGRTFHQVSLLEDQEYVLNQIISISRDARPDAVIVAGDIYDRAVPPADAVQLLGWVLEELVLNQGLPVAVIAGNHDSPDRIGFASSLLSAQGLHIRGALTEHIDPILIEDKHGPVSFCLLPYAEPPLVRERLGDDALRSHDAAMEALTRRIRKEVKTKRSVLVAHCFATGGQDCESERPLSIGGAGNVDTAYFSGFDYTALGHLHQPQALGPRVRYSGSLLKYSFSESEHEKAVSIVDLDASGDVSVEEVPLIPRRDVRVLEGSLSELLSNPAAHGSVEDYLLIRLTDKGAILDAMGKLREAFPNVLHLERPGLFRSGEVQVAGKERLSASERDLFASFFREMTGDELSDEQSRVFDAVVEELHQRAREVTA
jgi:exonuclease SbcD